MNFKHIKKSVQSGFTLVELIIVIVILGILAAVAIPKLSSTSSAAYAGVETATVGALKSAWSAAYAVNKGVAPNAAQIAAQMDSPTCTATAGKIGCTNGTVAVTKDGTTASVFITGAADNTTIVSSPNSISAQ
jgi:prepilin-type N-terminal cleavage/methylation domain-containing protein